MYNKNDLTKNFVVVISTLVKRVEYTTMSSSPVCIIFLSVSIFLLHQERNGKKNIVFIKVNESNVSQPFFKRETTYMTSVCSFE